MKKYPIDLRMRCCRMQIGQMESLWLLCHTLGVTSDRIKVRSKSERVHRSQSPSYIKYRPRFPCLLFHRPSSYPTRTNTRPPRSQPRLVSSCLIFFFLFFLVFLLHHRICFLVSNRERKSPASVSALSLSFPSSHHLPGAPPFPAKSKCPASSMSTTQPTSGRRTSTGLSTRSAQYGTPGGRS